MIFLDLAAELFSMYSAESAIRSNDSESLAIDESAMPKLGSEGRLAVLSEIS